VFDWLSEEIGSINTNKFHVFKRLDRQAVKGLEKDVGSRLPDSYREFLSAFGQATLYRDGDGYLVGVYLFTEMLEVKSDAPFFGFGYEVAPV